MVAIEIYVRKHSFLSLELLTENWYFAVSLLAVEDTEARDFKTRARLVVKLTESG